MFHPQPLLELSKPGFSKQHQKGVRRHIWAAGTMPASHQMQKNGARASHGVVAGMMPAGNPEDRSCQQLALVPNVGAISPFGAISTFRR